MILLAIILVIIVLLYIYGTRNFKYWEKRGVKHSRPIPFFGTYLKLYFAKKSVTQKCTEEYWKFPDEKVVGMYRMSKPALVIRDPEIIKKVLISDFTHFYPRGMVLDSKAVEPMMKNLFFADGDLWRLLRQRMTPAFTSGKLKAMFPLIVDCAEKLQGHLSKVTAAGQPIDSRELMARFTTDFIGSCAFGLNADSLSDENSAFRQLGVKIFKIPTKFIIREILKLMLPTFMRKNMKTMGHFEQDVIDLVQHIQKQRNNQKTSRNDFIDLMMECKKQGVITGESIEHINTNDEPEKVSLEITDELIAAQVFVFFAAGFETSSSATSFTLHKLAHNPEVQKKVQADVDKVLAKYNNKLNYDAVKEMTYLDWTFKEGLRMFPSLGFLRRACARKYTIPDLNIPIDEGVGIYIPLQALHNDPKYFDNPDVFNPDRFNPDNMKEESKLVYFPFGTGPRACIGERLGRMQSLAGLAAVISKFTVEPAPESLKYPVVDPRSHTVQSVIGGLPLYFRERKIEM